MEKIKFSKLGNSYIKSNGAYQKEFTEMFNRVVEISENDNEVYAINDILIKDVYYLYREYFKNRNINAREHVYDDVEYVCDCVKPNPENTVQCIPCKSCEECNGTGLTFKEEIVDTIVNDVYQKKLNKFLNILNIDKLLIEKLIHNIEKIIIRNDVYDGYYYSDENLLAYDNFIDVIMYHIINNK